MHGAKQSRAKYDRVQWHRAQLLRTAFSNATSNVTFECQRCRVGGGTESATEQQFRASSCSFERQAAQRQRSCGIFEQPAAPKQARAAISSTKAASKRTRAGISSAQAAPKRARAAIFERPGGSEGGFGRHFRAQVAPSGPERPIRAPQAISGDSTVFLKRQQARSSGACPNHLRT